MSSDYFISVEPCDEGGWIGTAPDFPDVRVWGQVKVQVMRQTVEAVKGLVKLHKELGHPLPDSKGAGQ